MKLKLYTFIRIYVPMAAKHASAEHDEPIDSDQNVLSVLSAMARYSFFGRLGNYTGVYEASSGKEGFHPLEGANPAEGNIGETSSLNSVCLMTYLPDNLSEDKLIAFLVDVAEAHPWEHPVIEVWRNGTLELFEPRSNIS